MTPSLRAQIATLLRITARLEAGGVVVAYPEELPSLSAALVTLQQRERLEEAARAFLEVCDDPDHDPQDGFSAALDNLRAALDTAAPVDKK